MTTTVVFLITPDDDDDETCTYYIRSQEAPSYSYNVVSGVRPACIFDVHRISSPPPPPDTVYIDRPDSSRVTFPGGRKNTKEIISSTDHTITTCVRSSRCLVIPSKGLGWRSHERCPSEVWDNVIVFLSSSNGTTWSYIAYTTGWDGVRSNACLRRWQGVLDVLADRSKRMTCYTSFDVFFFSSFAGPSATRTSPSNRLSRSLSPSRSDPLPGFSTPSLVTSSRLPKGLSSIGSLCDATPAVRDSGRAGHSLLFRVVSKYQSRPPPRRHRRPLSVRKSSSELSSPGLQVFFRLPVAEATFVRRRRSPGVRVRL